MCVCVKRLRAFKLDSGASDEETMDFVAVKEQHSPKGVWVKQQVERQPFKPSD